MTDDLVRLEYKLDLILHALMDKGIMVSDVPGIEGIEKDDCPVCGSRISLVPHYKSETLQYRCGCRLPKTIVPGISELTAHPEEKKHDNFRTTQDPDLLQPAPESGGSS